VAEAGIREALGKTPEYLETAKENVAVTPARADSRNNTPFAGFAEGQ